MKSLMGAIGFVAAALAACSPEGENAPRAEGRTADIAGKANQGSPQQQVSEVPFGSGTDDIEPPYSETYRRCMSTGQAATRITVAVLSCENAEFSLQDQALNDAYKTLYASSDASARARLVKSQRLWIKARDAACASDVSDAGDGSASEVALIHCQSRETGRRVIILKRFAENGGF